MSRLHGTVPRGAGPSLSCPLLILDTDFNYSCCVPGDEDSPSLAVTAALGPSWCQFGEQSTRFP